MLSSTKYRLWQNIGVNRILESTKYWRQQKIGVKKIQAHAKITYKSSEASPYCFGPAKSTAAGSSLTLLVLSSEDVVSSSCSCIITGYSLPASLFWRTSLAQSRPSCTARHAKKSKNIGVKKNMGTRQDFTDFCRTLAVNISASRRPIKKIIKAKNDHYKCPI
jgi:hypothetical protein